MYSQQQTTRAQFPETVTFVLAGRTTLSEHSPTESIDVGYEIAERSPYLRNFLPQHVSNDRPLLPIQLGDVDPVGFKLYIVWLTTNSIDSPSHKPLLLGSCIDLIYAHIVGSTFSAPQFQDHIIDTLSNILHPAQAPDLKVLEILFLEKHVSSCLKRFVIDRMFAHERKMLGMLRGFVEDMVTEKSDVKGCEYHVHGDQGKCYRQGQMKSSGELDVVEGRRWNVDDDVELNVMAAHYLGKTSMLHSTSGKPLGTQKRELRSSNIENRVLTNGARGMERDAVARTKGFHPDAIHTSSIHCHGSAASSRDVHTPDTSALSMTSSPDIDKPLPPLPASPSAATGTGLLENGGSLRSPNTQELVLECMGRLSPTIFRATTQDLIAECLARSSPSLRTAVGVDNIPSSLRLGPQPLIRDSSFLPLPKPNPDMNVDVPHSPPEDTLVSTGPSPPLIPPYTKSSSVHLPPLIKRKPAPPRGMDWLEQWDRLNALRGTQGFGLRKHDRRGKKSIFQEILGSVRR
ncbi:hypothetical protein BDW02DRAFT_536303 [Decorospora gaudefroyi]|uniref:BTB domain-containing protein n=1 Tax=Decorospora gaudefroyi TaxID=184978 RepID=A0A6A5JX95_9PLEO|nr:hypothetical protein BDW02DRAFT_536303 [Decorospora gaudefroyi]